MAQLGLKSAISERQNPQPVPLPELVIQIACWSTSFRMSYRKKSNIIHLVVMMNMLWVESDNNDDDDDQADQFGLVDMSGVIDIDQEKIIQIVAGDSHTLILSNMGKVYGKKE